MAFLSSSSARSNTDLINLLIREGVIKSHRVKSAMLAVDRGFFSPNHPYADSPQLIGYNATISAPHMHAHALEILKDKLHPESRVLDVGSGSGYLSACFWSMVGKTGRVIGIEHIEELVQQSVHNIKQWNREALENGSLKIVVGDGRKGYSSEAPYDAIHVGAGAAEIPKPLIEQLAPGGRLLIPVGKENSFQYLTQVDKDVNGNVSKTRLCDVMFVPLTEKDTQV